jgi:tetratricopeptide (TPR) repeat protein
MARITSRTRQVGSPWQARLAPKAHPLLAAILIALAPALPTSLHALSFLEQIAVDTFAEMREVEQYQLKIAEKHYSKGEYRIAMDEYDKFLTLYEKSAAAPYAQLMWGHCQVKLRFVNTAIRDGFQSVIDYWPDTTEAVHASYLIGKSYDNIGQAEKAEAGYLKTVNDYPDHHIATLAKVDLLHLAKVKKDAKKQMLLLAALTYDTKRTEANKTHVVNATRELATRRIYSGEYGEAIRALETTYKDGALVKVYNDIARGAISKFLGDAKTKEKGVELCDSVIGMVGTLIPTVLDTEPRRVAARDAYYRIAGLYGISGRPSEVLGTYQKMITILGEDDGLLGSLAGFHRGRKAYDKARSVYRRFKDKVKGQLEIAGTFKEEKRYAEAIAIYDDLKDRVLGSGLSASLYREIGKYDEAIVTYKTLIEIDREHIDAHRWAIGGCYESSNRLHNAIAAYGLVDNFPTTYFKMASCHRKLKEYKQALSLYSQCKVDAGKAPDAFMEIGYTYEEAGQRENAIRAFQLTCKNFPKSGHASRAHSHLQSKYDINVTLGGAKGE